MYKLDRVGTGPLALSNRLSLKFRSHKQVYRAFSKKVLVASIYQFFDVFFIVASQVLTLFSKDFVQHFKRLASLILLFFQPSVQVIKTSDRLQLSICSFSMASEHQNRVHPYQSQIHRISHILTSLFEAHLL